MQSVALGRNAWGSEAGVRDRVGRAIALGDRVGVRAGIRPRLRPGESLRVGFAVGADSRHLVATVRGGRARIGGAFGRRLVVPN